MTERMYFDWTALFREGKFEWADVTPINFYIKRESSNKAYYAQLSKGSAFKIL